MGFLKNILSGLMSSSHSEFFSFVVRCEHCNEIIEGKINLNNDLSLDDEGGYHVRKVLVGSDRCFQQVEAVLKFDAARKLLDKKVNGGIFAE